MNLEKKYKIYNRKTKATLFELMLWNSFKVTVSDPDILNKEPYLSLLNDVSIVFLPHEYYPKLKEILEDAVMELKQFEKMIEDLTILTDGKRLYSLSNSPQLTIAQTPIEMSKVLYEKYYCLTLVHAPCYPYLTHLNRLANPDHRIPYELKNLFASSAGEIFMEIVARHTKTKTITLQEIARKNEGFIDNLIDKYGFLNTKVYNGKDVYRLSMPNDYFPVKLLNPENQKHRKLFVMHRIKKRGMASPYGRAFLLAYLCPETLPETELDSITGFLKDYDPELLHLMPEEIQIRALTLL
ncbi:MAG: hypothetical protein QXJ58_07075 [Archaeoglobaceae archaeon]